MISILVNSASNDDDLAGICSELRFGFLEPTLQKKISNGDLKIKKSENKVVPELPENDQGNLTWNLGVWQLNFLP